MHRVAYAIAERLLPAFVGAPIARRDSSPTRSQILLGGIVFHALKVYAITVLMSDYPQILFNEFKSKQKRRNTCMQVSVKGDESKQHAERCLWHTGQ